MFGWVGFGLVGLGWVSNMLKMVIEIFGSITFLIRKLRKKWANDKYLTAMMFEKCLISTLKLSLFC